MSVRLHGDPPFPVVYVINLDHRSDRWKAARERCQECGLDPIRFSAVQSSPGWVGRARSHLGIIEVAKRSDLPWILILEDDADFDVRAIDRFRSLLPTLWALRHEWERFSGGPTLPVDPDVCIFNIHHQLMYAAGFATHFDLINESAYDLILRWNSEVPMPIDVYYRHLSQEDVTGFRSLCTYPHIATQRVSNGNIVSGRSDVLSDRSSFFHYSGIKLRECLIASARHAEGMLNVQVAHPHWSGLISISINGNFVWHRGTSSVGTYLISNDMMEIAWYDYPSESFLNISGVWVYEDLVRQAPPLNKFFIARIGITPILIDSVSVKIPSEEISVQLRTGTSDMAVYNQVFVEREYEFPHLPEEAKTIIDLGANIGLTSLFFALKYRDANILSVEPDSDNFGRLIRNIGHFRDRVKPLKGAAWSRDGNLRLVKQDANEASLDSWGVRVSPEIDDKSFDVQCFSIPTLIGHIDGDSIDILKIDIEGSEKEIFTHSPEKWIGKIKMIVVETHDRFQPGCEEAVREAVKDKFLELERSGELLIFRSLLSGGL